MRWTLRSLLVVVVLCAVAMCVVLPMQMRAMRNAKVTSCVSNLHIVWGMQHNYAMNFGGRERLMPHELGGDFWLKGTRIQPPLIDRTLKDVFLCPVHGKCNRRVDYRGPASDINVMADGDVVGADIDGNHGRGEGGNVVCKSGGIQSVRNDDPLWRAAARTTRE